MTKKRQSSVDFEDTLRVTIKNLVKKRGVIKSKFSLFVKFVESLTSTDLTLLQKTELSTRLQKAETLLEEFTEIQDELDLKVSDDQKSSESLERETFQNRFYSVVSSAKCMLTVQPATESIPTTSSKGKNRKITLPTISLPSFDGSYDKWLPFRSTYLSLIHEVSDIDDIEKLHYLKSAVTGNALNIINSLELIPENYSVAWSLLESRYNNNRLLITNHVKALFNIPSIRTECPFQIRKLIDTVVKNLRLLNNLGEPTQSWDTLIIHLMVTKLDSSTEKQWENYKSRNVYGDTQDTTNSSIKITLDFLLKFLRNHADELESVKSSHSKSHDNTHTTHNHTIKKFSLPTNTHTHISPPRLTHNYISLQNNKLHNKNIRVRRCNLCNGVHSLYSCGKFINMSFKDKTTFLNNNKLCTNCLRAGHNSSECWFGSCKHCNSKHNSLLHCENINNDTSNHTSSMVAHTNTLNSLSSPPVVAHTELSSADNSQVTLLHASTHKSLNINSPYIGDNHVNLLNPVLLSTALVEVADTNNRYHTCRALLDNGSQHSFITESLCKKLNARVIQSTINVTGVGNSVTQSTHSCFIHMRSKTSNFNKRFNCLVLPRITAELPSFNINNIRFNFPDNIILADPYFNSPDQVDLLIGADLFWELLNEGLLRLPAGPYLQNTKCGWILAGSLNTSNMRINNHVQCNFSQSLDIQLKKFWELEEIPTNSYTPYSKQERFCEELFTKTTKREADGRFSVRIPLTESADALGDTYTLALNRFHSLERKLDNEPKYKQMYCDFMSEYLNMGHMTRINSYCKPYYFLPHHGVFREHSTTSRLRVVFNASTKSSANLSLNDIQHSGPMLQNDIFSILLRFRQHKFIACADIEKFFRQVNIQPNQRNLQCILWRSNKSDELGMYQLNTVTYGTASAPYLSMRCLKQLVSDFKGRVDNEVISRIDEDFYVDDLITGHDDKERLMILCEQISNILKTGCFNLRKWVYNYDFSLNNVTSKELSLGENCQNKTLGLGWFYTTDELYFTSKFQDNIDDNKITKRYILSIISQIYDPLGLLSPTIILAKFILQKLWLNKLDWDDIIPKDILLAWKQFTKTLCHLPNLRIPRHVISKSNNKDKQIELHIYCDASKIGYGACAFIRSYDKHTFDSLTVHLICAKGKVAPVKPVSIPRLELCAALVGARLYQKIIKSLKSKFNQVYFYTDSTIVLGWLNTSPSLLKLFVQNRCVEINELTNGFLWLHIDSKNNPADLLSRGVPIDALQSCQLWWKGPSYLSEPNSAWLDNNKQIYNKINYNELPELKSNTTISMSCTTNDFNLFDRYSSFNRLKRVFAYVLRFISNIKIKLPTKRQQGALSIDELDNSLKTLAKISQIQSFPHDYDNLSTHKKSSKNLQSLNLFIDDSGLIRVGGRLIKSDEFSYSKKHPILLSSKHNFTRLLFEFQHKKLLHIGPQSLLYNIRESWWPLGGRNLSKKVVRNCVICTRIKGKTIVTQMGNLPLERIQSNYAFYSCGVDYCGPLLYLDRTGRGAKLVKCYICLFVCFATKAIHLELVTSLTTDSYLLALKRFISRRGKPAQIFSDNGKNFVGAAKEFSSFLSDNSQSIIDYAANESIKFSFIPPYLPHFGGLWEAGVKSCKYHLRRVMGNAHLTFEELSTLLTLIESILNSRPISPMSSDPSDPLPLTPAHFLIGRPLTAAPCDDITEVTPLRLSRYARVEQLRQHFWSRWMKEYISELQTRTKWKTKKDDLTPNTLVVIKEDHLPPLRWRLGRIIKTLPGTDGISRVADIRTSSGVIRRGYPKICPLFNYEENSHVTST